MQKDKRNSYQRILSIGLIHILFSNQQFKVVKEFNPVFKYKEATPRHISLLMSSPYIFKMGKNSMYASMYVCECVFCVWEIKDVSQCIESFLSVDSPTEILKIACNLSKSKYRLHFYFDSLIHGWLLDNIYQ